MELKKINKKLDKIGNDITHIKVKVGKIETKQDIINGSVAKNIKDIQSNTNFRYYVMGGFAVIIFSIGILAGVI